MRKTAIAVALATSALASPALARDGAFYIGAEGGAMIVEDTDLATRSNNLDSNIDADYGYDFDGIVGYDFGVFRIEAEGGYRRAKVDSFNAPQGFVQGFAPTPISLIRPGNFDGAGGHLSNLSFMVNGLLDFGPNDGIQGFVGGGAGVARTKLNVSIDPARGLISDSDTGFAYQALAGVRAPLTANIDAGLKYRFMTQPNVDLISAAGQGLETRWRSHSLLGSLIFNFGAPAPVVVAPPPAPVYTPPPPPPAPVAPVVQRQCATGPYIVFFELDKSDITSAAASVLDNALASYRDCGNARVMLSGYTDRSASVPYNLALSARRNASVQSYMTGRGLSAANITTQAFGEANPRVPTADGVREPQNRRVEITYGPGSGM